MSDPQFLLSGDLDASDPGALDDECSSTAPYVLSVPAQPPGTVCLFGGDYSFPDNPPLTVPPVPCGVSAPEGVCVCVCVCVCVRVGGGVKRDVTNAALVL